MSDFVAKVAAGSKKQLSEKAQKHAGNLAKGDLSAEHTKLLQTLRQLIDNKEIDPYDPKTFLKQEVYSTLDEQWTEKTDLALMNIATLLRQLYDLYISTDTPDESPQYQTMIEQLFDMKQRIEQHHDVFKF